MLKIKKIFAFKRCARKKLRELNEKEKEVEKRERKRELLKFLRLLLKPHAFDFLHLTELTICSGILRFAAPFVVRV